MDWPVVPTTVSARAKEIYQQGLLMGNNSHAFSKIGDCQSVPASFMGIYERSGQYSFSSENVGLQETIDYYPGSFGREGEAVRGGFSAATVLSPMWANAEVCQPGETPVECENRVHNPSIAFISLEVWFAGRTPEVYENYLRRVIDYNIEQGVLPILATKADNVEGDYSINYTIAKLAYEYDLPLWNFWRAVQPLPNHGLDPTDETGFHLNVDGWNMRSLSALEVLDTVTRALEGTETGEAANIEPTPVPTTIPAFTPGPVDGLPFSEADSYAETESPGPNILMEISIHEGEQLTSTGIYQGTLNGTDWQALAESGSELVDFSTQGILLSQENNLYLLKDNNERRLLTGGLYSTSSQPAVWLPDGHVAAIVQNDEKVQVAIIDPSNDSLAFIPAESASPIRLYPSLDPGHIYWSAGECNATECIVQEFLTSTIDGSDIQSIPYVGEPAIARDGTLAFMGQDADETNQLILINGSDSRTLSLFGNRVMDMVWSPDGETLAVTTALVSGYSGRTLESRLYFVNWPATIDTVLAVPDDVIEKTVWSPDGTAMLVVHRDSREGDLQLRFAVLDVARQFEFAAKGFQLTSSKYVFPYPVYWMP